MSDRLKEIEARLAVVTPGPWVARMDANPQLITGGDEWVASTWPGVSRAPKNADLIAHAPADLALLASIVRSVADSGCDGYADGIARGMCGYVGAPYGPGECWPCRIRRELSAGGAR